MRPSFYIRFVIYVGPFASIAVWPPWHQAANVILDPFTKSIFATFVLASFIWLAMGMGVMAGRSISNRKLESKTRMNLNEWVFRCTGYAIGMMLGTTIDYFLFQLVKIQFPILLLGTGMTIATVSFQTIRYRTVIFGEKPKNEA